MMNFKFNWIIWIIFTWTRTCFTSKIRTFTRIFSKMNTMIKFRCINFNLFENKEYSYYFIFNENLTNICWWIIKSWTDRPISCRWFLWYKYSSIIFFESISKFWIRNRWWKRFTIIFK